LLNYHIGCFVLGLLCVEVCVRMGWGGIRLPAEAQLVLQPSRGRNARHREHSPHSSHTIPLRCITIFHAQISLGLSNGSCDLLVIFHLPPPDTSVFHTFSFCTVVYVFRTAYR